MTKVVKVVDEARVEFATVFSALQNTVEVTEDTKACFVEIELATNKWLKSEKSLDDLLAFREASDAFFASLRTYQHEAPYQDALLAFQAHLKYLRTEAKAYQDAKAGFEAFKQHLFRDASAQAYLLSLALSFLIHDLFPFSFGIMFFSYFINYAFGQYLSEIFQDVPFRAAHAYYEIYSDLFWPYLLPTLGLLIASSGLYGLTAGFLFSGPDMMLSIAAYFLASASAASLLVLTLPSAVVLAKRGVSALGDAMYHCFFPSADEETAKADNESDMTHDYACS